MAIGEDKYFKWDYSETSDILNIHRQKRKVDGSAELGDFTVDFDKKGNIVGVEITNVSDFLIQAEVSKEQLEGIKCAEIAMDKRNPNMIIIWVKLMLPNNVEKRIPIPAPVMATAAA